MKKFAVLLLCSCLSLFWICGGVGVPASCGNAPGASGSAGVQAPSTELAFEVLRQTASIFEVPAQVRIPATEHAGQVLRIVPGLQSAPVFAACAADSANKVFHGQSPRPFSWLCRSVDRYVYALRKIII